jgi:hypothetical protein
MGELMNIKYYRLKPEERFLVDIIQTSIKIINDDSIIYMTEYKKDNILIEICGKKVYVNFIRVVGKINHILDDNKTDDTIEFIKNFLLKLLKKEKLVVLYRDEREERWNKYYNNI